MSNPVTLTYKTVPALNFDSDGGPSDVPLYLDVYPPDSHLNGTSASEDDGVGVPAVVYFHAGGLLVGDRRRSWFPEWLHSECFLVPSIRLRLLTGVLFHTGRLSGQGIAFISADYRLLLPSTGHEIIEDIQDLFGYIRNDLNFALAGVTWDPPLRINVDAIAVAGTSGGGLCAYLSAIHLSPKPKVLLSMYGQGGECLVSHLRYPSRSPVSIFT
jgi:acetyl esterase/lipase